MSKFNSTVVSKTKTTNLAGGEAYRETSKLELTSLLLTSFVNEQFYRSEKGGLDKARELISMMAQKDPLFIAKAAIYARTKFGMRSISHVVAGELFRQENGKSVISGKEWGKRFIDRVIYRPDDALEIMAYFKANVKEKAIPNQLRKGIALALTRFNDYTLAKYKGEGKSFKQIDLVNLTHPRHTPTIAKLVNGELISTDTWESKLSLIGQQDVSEAEKLDLKGAAWKELILEKKIGYFALLRNLRNILRQAPDVLDEACKMLIDEKLIKNSLVLPFRFQTAINEIKILSDSGARKILVALNKAVDIACSNVPVFNGKTLVVLDVSGSMQGKPSEIGSLFSAILVKANDADFIKFSDIAVYENINILDSTLTISDSIQYSSGGTNFHSIFKTANKAYDRIIILSDMQGWMGDDTPRVEYLNYIKKYNCSPNIFSFDLSGYGSLQFPEKNIFCIAGFSDKVFDLMTMLESDQNAMINEIEKVEF